MTKYKWKVTSLSRTWIITEALTPEKAARTIFMLYHGRKTLSNYDETVLLPQIKNSLEIVES